MNAMRRLLSGSGASGSGQTQNSGGQDAADGEFRIPNSQSQHAALSLMHLRKLFGDYSSICQTLTEKERDERLYSMLPLFCRVFGTTPSSEMAEKFPEIVTFSQAVARMLVSETRHRAANQSTTEASFGISRFLEIDSSEELSNGWMLLTTSNLLASAGQTVIEVMAAAAVPSTLVKSLYLFFDLPEIQNGDMIEAGNDFSAKETRVLLQKVFSQILVKLCTYPIAVEELAKEDDLQLLFGALTSWCPTYNSPWRKVASETLVTMTRHCLTPQVLGYIHNKGCISMCVENMQRTQHELTPLELVEMFVTMFCLLKDSAEFTPCLLEDFRSAHGYSLLVEFLLSIENDTSAEAQEAVRNLVLLVAPLATCGFSEIRPPPGAGSGSIFQMPGFTVPQPAGRGGSIRNVQAFQVLQTVFLRANSSALCSIALDAISNLYHSDDANYFILEAETTLPRFAEIIHTKPTEIQEKFFKLHEFLIFQLNYIPCRELISLSLIIRNQHLLPCSVLATVALLTYLRFNAIFKDVYREVGLLEVFMASLQRFASSFSERTNSANEGKDLKLSDQQEKSIFVAMEVLCILMNGNTENVDVFRGGGGTRCVQDLVLHPEVRRESLGILQQLVLTTGAEEDMGALLGLLQNSNLIEVKVDVLKSILSVLRESHRTRTVFRRVSGFVYLMSILVSMEGSLSEPPPPAPWDSASRKDILRLLHLTFNTLAIALRFEPANAKYFLNEICNTGLCDSLRLLGCFSKEKTLTAGVQNFLPSEEASFHTLFHAGALEDDEQLFEKVPVSLRNACLVFRLLFDLAVDAYDRSPPTAPPRAGRAITADTSTVRKRSSSRSEKSHLSLQALPVTPLIAHPGVVLSMYQLVPSIFHQSDLQMAATLQTFIVDRLKGLLKSERNLQIMCDALLPNYCLTIAKLGLLDESHLLHGALMQLLERLAVHALEPKDLRNFLRLGGPLMSISPELPKFEDFAFLQTVKYSGQPVPLSRIKTLVAMATPQGASSVVAPPFVEFDMSSEGFGALFIPSLAPQAAGSPGVVGMSALGVTGDMSVNGGIGMGDRVFPPPAGLTYSSWIYVEKYSDAKTAPHPVRLLTVLRSLAGKEEQYICLSLVLSARDKTLIVSTQECPLSKAIGEWEPDVTGDGAVRILYPDLMHEGQWHHMVFVFNKSVLKHSQFSLYVNGQHIHTCKLQYISQNPGGVSGNLVVTNSVNALIGTSPTWRKLARTCWRQGPCHLVEDVWNHHTVQLVHGLGPRYLGCFQAPDLQGQPESLGSLVTEERLIFSITAAATSSLTLAKIKKVYNKTDSRSIAKQLGMSTNENATPIHILHNAAGHLAGAARSLGGVIIGYMGARVFCPRPVSTVIQAVGGTSVLLGLIAMARDTESLYAAVKAMVCVIKAEPAIDREMERTLGYQTLATLLRRHKSMLNNHILQLIFGLVGTVDSGRETLIIPTNLTAFRDLLCDLEVWKDTNGDLLRSLIDHFYELLSESSEKKNNLKALRELNMVARLLYLLKESHIPLSTTQAALNALRLLLAVNPRPVDLLCFGQFVASTLPNTNVSEKSLKVRDLLDRRETSLLPADLQSSQRATEDTLPNSQTSQTLLRNRCLKVLLQLISGSRLQQSFCDELIRVLGFDWILMFMQGHLHPSSVIISLRVLTVIVSHSSYLQRFREGGSNSGWFRQTELIMQNRLGSVFGFQIGSALSKVGGSVSHSNEESTPHIPGFSALQNMLPKHFDVPEVYFLLIGMLLGQPGHNLPMVPQLDLDLDTIWSCVFGVGPGQNSNSTPGSMLSKGLVCPEAVICLLGLIRMMMNQDSARCEHIPPWLLNYPVSLTQFLFYLYHNSPDAISVFMSGELLSALEATVYPISDSEPASEPLSPFEELKNIEGAAFFVNRNSLLGDGDSSQLSSHPAKKFVMDFLKNLVVDSLSLSQSSKSTPVIDLLLEGSPEGSSHVQQCRFQTEVLTLLMDHLVAADILIGEQAALPVVVGGSISNIASNVIYLSGRLVDKLWLGYFQKDPHEVFDFVVKLISQSKRRSSSSTLSLDHLYRCLNRTILFTLSRPIGCTLEQTSVLNSLHKLTQNRTLIFGAGNHDLEFVGCLTYCLVNIVVGHKIPVDYASKSAWHVVSNPADNEANVNIISGHNLIVIAARRVWDEMYITKKPAIEEAFKVSVSTSNSTPSMEQIRDIIQDPGHKLWLAYVESEKRASASKATPPWELHTQLQSRLQKVTGGLTRLGSRTKAIVVSTAGLKREESVSSRPRNSSLGSANQVTLTFPEWQAALIGHVAVIKEQVKAQISQYQQNYQHVQKYILDEWNLTEKELLRERGLWGSDIPSSLDKWMLDVTEGPCRMRKKLIRNDLFYHQYPYRPESESGDRQVKYKVAVSFDSKPYYQLYHNRCKALLFDQKEADSAKKLSDDVPSGDVADSSWNGAAEIKPVAEETGVTFEERTDLGLSELPSLLKKSGNKSTSDTEEDFDGLDIDIGVDASSASVTDLAPEQCSAHQTLLALLDEGEKISHMFRCARVQGLDTVEGLVLFGREHCYVVDGYTLLRSREVMDIQSLPPGLHEPIIPPTNAPLNTFQTAVALLAPRLCSKIAYADIKEVHIRKYLLQPNALELFSTDGRNYLLAFPRVTRNKVYQRFLAMATSISDNAQQSVAGQKRTASVEQTSGLLSTFMGETSVTQRWVRGEISNFQYLMYLNTLAGRSYNDLMQYPVFPWVLADYDSPELDLTDPATFRDLSKPMGAQTPDRLEQFKKRYKEWEDPHLETPPYHYGTHYSSAMIVCSYLIRLEPFTQHFLNLQGGHFDLADRMFHSIREGWYSAAKHNMADVKELIPEFFYLPDFLVNGNNFDLGVKQSGVQLGDVLLPPWAKNDPREFIRVHRQALECDYVSAHLHEWIDLIFGCKQQGPGAVEAVNVFHHLFYEGNVDIYSIEDPLKRNAIVGFINNFGQTPKPLFKKSHPAKKHTKGMFPTDFSQVATSMGSAASDRLFFHHLHTLRPSQQPVKELKRPVGQIVQQDRAILAVEENKVFMPPSNTRCVSWGFADHTLRITAYENERTILVCESQLFGDILACVCPMPKVIVSGGSDTDVTVWEVGRKHLEVKKRLYAHTDAVTCLAAKQTYQIIVSGSRDGTAIIWDLSRLTFVRQLRDHDAPVTAVAINELTGDIATCGGTWLYLWSVNGEPIASVNTLVGRSDRMQQILCVAFSQALEWDVRNVILTGSTDGVVRMWSVDYVQVPIDEKRTAVSQEASKQEVTEPRITKEESELESSDDEEDQSAELQKKLQSIIAENQELLTGLRGDAKSVKGQLTRQSSVDEPIKSSDMDVFYQDVFDQNVDGTLDMESFDDFDSRSGSFDVREDGSVRSLSVDQPDKAVLRDRKFSPSMRAKLCKSEGNILSRHTDFSDDSDEDPIEKPKPLKSSKSVSSLGEPFVVVGSGRGDVSATTEPATSSKEEAKPKTKEPKNALREGFKWQRQLVFSSKLTMHTAFDRPDNAFPASITALQVSKDHRSIFVGDARGRIYSWSVADVPGKSMADYWLKDEGAESCRACTIRFSLTERKHHCRNCGHVFCSKCSRFESEITRLRIRRPVRVCQTCYQVLRQANESQK